MAVGNKRLGVWDTTPNLQAALADSQRCAGTINIGVSAAN